MPGLAASRWAPKSSQALAPETTTSVQQAEPATTTTSPPPTPAKPRGGLSSSRYANAPPAPSNPSPNPSPVVAKPSRGKPARYSQPKEQVYSLPPWAGLSKEEYYGLVQRCAGRCITEREWNELAEGVKDCRALGTWGADWRTQ